MRQVLLYVALFYVGACHGQEDGNVYSVVSEDNGKTLKIVQEREEQQRASGLPPIYASAQLTGNIQKSGWAFFQVKSTEGIDDKWQARAAGQLEGSMTADLISMHWQNILAEYCAEEPSFCFKLGQFLGENLLWMRYQIDRNPNDDYWHQIDVVLEQLEGLKEGYRQNNTDFNKADIPDYGFLLLQLAGDLDGLEQALGRKTPSRIFGSGSCSALVKLLPGNEDLLISHTTWNSYDNMLRLFKFYDLPFQRRANKGADTSDIVPGQKLCFSSYPGRLLSWDDFYMISSGLLVQETTLVNGNPALWKYVQPVGCVLEWLRNLVANRLATTAQEWVEIFSKHNSGTYNNQWMVVDYNLFSSNQALVPGTFWVLEQLPGTVETADMTTHLQEKRYWASYNLPFFPKIYNMSGEPENVKKYGPFFDYHLTPRAQIFKRDQGKVKDLDSLMTLMRYNDYEHDPLSKCSCTPPYSAESTISARSDLNPPNGSYPFNLLGHRSHGGIDCKVTSSHMFNNLSCLAVSGPTNEQQPVFRWSTSGWKRPMGHPDAWDFKPVTVKFNPI